MRLYRIATKQEVQWEWLDDKWVELYKLLGFHVTPAHRQHGLYHVG